MPFGSCKMALVLSTASGVRPHGLEPSSTTFYWGPSWASHLGFLSLGFCICNRRRVIVPASWSFCED